MDEQPKNQAMTLSMRRALSIKAAKEQGANNAAPAGEPAQPGQVGQATAMKKFPTVAAQKSQPMVQQSQPNFEQSSINVSAQIGTSQAPRDPRLKHNGDFSSDSDSPRARNTKPIQSVSTMRPPQPAPVMNISDSAINDSIDMEAARNYPDLFSQIPNKPVQRSSEELAKQIRLQIGFDLVNLYKDSEVNQSGMVNLMGLRSQVEIEEEIQTRQTKYKYYLDIAKSQFEQRMSKYKQFKQDHPHLFKKKVVDNKRKKPTIGKPQEKRIKQQYEDWDSSEKIESGDVSEIDESEYESGNKRKGKQILKRRNLTKTSHHRDRENQSSDSASQGSDLDQGRRQQRRANNTLANAGIDVDGNSALDESNRKGSLELDADHDRQKQVDFEKQMKEYRQAKASFMDFKQCVLKRTKIEQWVDEPFFKNTLLIPFNERQPIWETRHPDSSKNGGVYVKVGLGNKKYAVGEVREIKDDPKFKYRLTNGQMTGIRLRLQLKEDRQESFKWFKITQISDQNIEYDNEFYDFREYKIRYGNEGEFNMEMAHYRKTAIQNARNYIYKKGEADAIVNRNFDRALKEGNIGQFPNVEYFREKRDIEIKLLRQQMGKAERGTSEYKTCENNINKLQDEIDKINDFLQKDLRVTKFANSEGVQQITVNNLEEQEDKKAYHQWVESQQKIGRDQDELQDNSHVLDDKEALQLEIRQIQHMNAGKEIESHYTRVQRTIRQITAGHKQINAEINQEKFSSQRLNDFSCDLLKLKKSKQKYISKVNPNRPQELRRQNVGKAISLEEYLKN